jgi:hypothetical protein
MVCTTSSKAVHVAQAVIATRDGWFHRTHQLLLRIAATAFAKRSADAPQAVQQWLATTDEEFCTWMPASSCLP